MTAPARVGRQALAFIFITVLLDMMALGMVAPVLPQLVTQHLSSTATAAAVFGLFNTVFALMQFFFSPVIGALSDRFGRRPLILVSNLGLGLNYVLMAWAPNLYWLFLGRVISGVTGASFGTASAYIADTTPAEERAHAFGMLGAAFGAGFVLGPAFGGLIGEHFGPKGPFWVAAALSLANACYGLFVLPESLPKACRTGFQWRRANPIGALILLRQHPELFALSGVIFLSNLAQVSLPSTIVLYATHRYGWGPTTLGLTLALVGVALIVVQVGVVGRFVRYFGPRAALVTGLLFGVCGLTVVAVAETGNALWSAIPVLALWGIAGPAAQGIMTKHVSAAEQGQLQGANASLVGIAELVGPSVFTLTFANFVRAGQPPDRAGAPFLLAAALLLVAAVWAFFATRKEATNRILS